eukprot:SAG25_NODE_555_length_6955_cov_15.736289_3_plen_147_part_00
MGLLMAAALLLLGGGGGGGGPSGAAAHKIKAQLLSWLRTSNISRWQYLVVVFLSVVMLVPSTPIETYGGYMFGNSSRHDVSPLGNGCVALIGSGTATCDILELWCLASAAKMLACDLLVFLFVCVLCVLCVAVAAGPAWPSHWLAA